MLRQQHDRQELAAALAGVTLIEATDEREEALAIAVCLRESLERPGRTAALVTPDRGLAERVRAELLRWNVEIDDSGGSSLASSRAGVMARLILSALCGGLADWAALLAHPDFSLGFAGEAERLCLLFEIGVLRSGLSGEDFAGLVEPAREAAQERRAHPRQHEISAEDWAALQDLAEKLDAAFAPLRTLASAPGETGLKPWLDAHARTLGLIVAGDENAFPGGEDGEALAVLFAELAQASNAVFTFHAESYAAFYDALINERILRGPSRAHPRVKILGLLEARLIGADRLVLAGLDETVWPPAGESDAFLNRAMRAELKLSSPDRRIGQTAHDFAQGFGAPEVILTRAKKRGGAPTTPSRFLQRMEALAGAAVSAPLRERGQDWLELARRIDDTPPTKPLARPAPRPPLNLRPTKLSVTRIETLRRDPYAVYAEFILKLLPLPPLDADLGPREIGNALHKVLEEFCAAFPEGPLPDNAREILIASAEEKLAAFSGDAEFQAFRWPRLLQGLDAYLDFERERRPNIEHVHVEKGGRLAIPLADGSTFDLTGTADRIEFMKDGTAVIVDYKTGAPPSVKEVRAGWSPQLTLEAAMESSGAFRDLPMREVSAAIYLPLGGGGKKPRDLDDPKKGSFGDLVSEHFDELVGLLNHFRNPEHGYPARPFPQFAARYNAYDHLARTREWSAAGGEPSGETSRERARNSGDDAGAAGPRLRPRGFRLGVGQRRFRKDARAGAKGDPPAARRQCAGPHPLPHLHQGGGGQYGRAGVQEPGCVVVARRRGARRRHRGDRRAAPARPSAAEACAKTFRARGGDAGRPENPDPARLLRTRPARRAFRGQCRGGFRDHRRGAAGAIDRARENGGFCPGAPRKITRRGAGKSGRGRRPGFHGPARRSLAPARLLPRRRRRKLRLALGLASDDTPEKIARDLLEGGIDPARCGRLRRFLSGGTRRPTARGPRCSRAPSLTRARVAGRRRSKPGCRFLQ